MKPELSKNYRKSPFLQIFIWLFSYYFLFFFSPYTILILLPYFHSIFIILLVRSIMQCACYFFSFSWFSTLQNFRKGKTNQLKNAIFYAPNTASWVKITIPSQCFIDGLNLEIESLERRSLVCIWICTSWSSIRI